MQRQKMIVLFLSRSGHRCDRSMTVTARRCRRCRRWCNYYSIATLFSILGKCRLGNIVRRLIGVSRQCILCFVVAVFVCRRNVRQRSFVFRAQPAHSVSSFSSTVDRHLTSSQKPRFVEKSDFFFRSPSSSMLPSSPLNLASPYASILVNGIIACVNKYDQKYWLFNRTES